uniref:Ig-like domain-containing protein n=1 Tax=Pseudonaja textilis TaxID=8673 RepID=A0A670ZNJ3_PSETE
MGQSGEALDEGSASDTEMGPGPSGNYMLTPEPPESDSNQVLGELSAPSSFSSTFHTLKRLRVNSSDVVSADPPVVTVTRRVEAEDEKETHICRVHGFYPRVVNASWTRDGEVWLQDTLHGSVAPNADATYHYWLSIQIDPKERGRYKCHVEHDGLQEPLDVALKDEGFTIPFLNSEFLFKLVNSSGLHKIQKGELPLSVFLSPRSQGNLLGKAVRQRGRSWHS